MNELTSMFVHGRSFGFVRSFGLHSYIHFKKKGKGTLSTSPEIKKQIQIKNSPLCSFRTVRSASFVRSGSISLKERGKR